jgi:hypothetical protein
MNLTQAIFRNSFFCFVLLLGFAFWGFWVTYFARPAGTVASWEHLHGVAMFGWCAMLIAQSFLVRSSRRDLHRALGKLSYALAPLIVVSTIALANFRLNLRGPTAEGIYVLGLQLFLLLQVIVFYTQAIRHRRRPDVHARWMVCTALTLIDPIFARILLVNFLQMPVESQVAQYFTFAMIDLILLALVLRDLKESGRRDVFLPALALTVATQVLMLNVQNIPAWWAFAEWFMALPLR